MKYVTDQFSSSIIMKCH